MKAELVVLDVIEHCRLIWETYLTPTGSVTREGLRAKNEGREHRIACPLACGCSILPRLSVSRRLPPTNILIKTHKHRPMSQRSH